ncbi:MAG TPA: hydroxymethylbilane synthase [Actinomycetota bacterium]|nr:hydroxymethylbilane synthase [Actinomycetota bacterium]
MPRPPDAPAVVTIASRGSRLARRQADIVAGLLRAAHPALEVAIATVTTTGDRDRRPFEDIAGTGLFVKEVEREVVEGRADLAVHSAKDLTARLAPGCSILCVPRRADPADAVVGGRGASGEHRLASLAPGAVVGTSSARRRALLAEARGDLEVAELRGNLDTRLAKVERGELDAAIVAAAGLERLGRDDLVATGRLDASLWVPAPGQGALAVEGVTERGDLAALVRPLDDAAAAAALQCERAFAAALEGGCSVPLGCLCVARGADLVATGFLGAPEGGSAVRDRVSGPAAHAAELGAELARALLDAGGDAIIAEAAAGRAPEPTAP